MLQDRCMEVWELESACRHVGMSAELVILVPTSVQFACKALLNADDYRICCADDHEVRLLCRPVLQ